MQIQPVMNNYHPKFNPNFQNKSLIEKNISKTIKEMNLDERDLRQVVRELENMKFNLQFRLLPYSSTAIKSDSKARNLAAQLAEVNCALNILSPRAENTLK